MNILARMIRAYTFNSPIRKGKGRLSDLALGLSRHLPSEILVSLPDGRRLYVDPRSIMYRHVYFIGEYERFISNLVRQIVKPGDVCVDVGANIGWHTTLLRSVAGDTGRVHAFEPMPNMFQLLDKNVALLTESRNVIVNNIALGDENTSVALHVFAGLTEGQSSISDMGRSDFETFDCRMATLDSYLNQHGNPDITFAKVDIEGAELMMLRGAEALFKQKTPPMLIVEMALATSTSFGYVPNDLIEHIRSRASYEFFALDEVSDTLTQIDGFLPKEIGANVLCVPKGAYRERIVRLPFVS